MIKIIICGLLLWFASSLSAAPVLDGSAQTAIHNGTHADLTQTVGAENTILFASISIISDTNQEVTLATLDGVTMTVVAISQLSTNVRQEVWSITNPVTGTVTLSVDITPTVHALVAMSTYTGVSLTAPVYFDSTGVGQGVLEVPMILNAINGNVFLGFGLAEGDASVITFTGQTLIWDNYHDQEPFYRSQAVLSPLTFTGQITTRNDLDKTTNWSICVIGLQAE